MPRSRKPKPAFPLARTTETVAVVQDAAAGLTDREFYAAAALLGIRMSGATADAAFAAKAAVMDADCLIAELAKGGAK